MEHVLWNYGKALSFTLEDALYTQASESLMWGGLYGLSKAKIKGRWNPYIYDNDKSYDLVRTVNWKEAIKDLFNLDSEPKDEEKNKYVDENGDLIGWEKNIDYIRCYIPCEEKIGYAYIRINPHHIFVDANNIETKLLKRNGYPVKINYLNKDKQELTIYDRDWFANYLRNNLQRVELQVNNFEKFENNIVYAEEYEWEDSWRDKPGYVTDTFIDTLNNIKNWIPNGDVSHLVEDMARDGINIIGRQYPSQEYINENWKYYFRYYYPSPNGGYFVCLIFTNQSILEYNTVNGNTIITGINGKNLTSGDVVLEGFTYFFEQRGSGPIHFEPINVNIDFKMHVIQWMLPELSTNDVLADTNINWTVNGETITEHQVPLDNINEYKWNNCDVSLLSSSNSFNNIAVADNLNICYHTLDFNSNKRFLFYNNEREKWQEDIDLSTKVELRVTNIDGDECTLTKDIPLGIFYIVEDENYVVPQASNFINPIDTAIENRRIMESTEMLNAKKQFAINVDKNLKSFNYSQLPEYNKTPLTIFYNPNTMKPYEPNEYALYKENGEKIEGNFKIFKQGENYIKWTRRIASAGTAIGQTITFNKHNFPYNFKLVGETYIRDRYGEDMHYQIELYNCAILDSISLNLAATGESNTVNIKMKALTDSCGDVGRLTIYNYNKNNYEININNYDITKLDEDFVEQQKIYATFDILEQLPNILVSDEFKIKILHPKTNTIFCLDQDCQVPIVPEVPITNTTYLRLVTPIGEDWKDMDYEEYYNSIKNKLQKEDLLIAKIDGRNRIQGFVNSEDLENIEFLESTQGGNE